MLTATDFSPALRRRWRAVILAGVIAAGASVGTYTLTGPSAPPTLDKPETYATTPLAPHVVVYSVPTSTGLARGGAAAPQLTDDHGGQTTLTTNGPPATITTTGGHTISETPSTDNGGAGNGGGGGANGPFPPLQTTSTTPQATTNPPASTPDTPPSPSPNPPVTSGARPARMLMQIQCPASMPTDSLCLEAVTTSGAPASLPTTNLGNLPVVSTPDTTSPTCPTTTTSGSTESNSPNSDNSGDSDNSSGNHDRDSGDANGGHRHHSNGGAHSSSGHSDGKHDNTGDTSSGGFVVGAGGGVNSSAPTVASCGLLDQTTGAVTSLGSVAGDKDFIPNSLNKIVSGTPRDVRLRTTGYSFQDNTPPNSDTISCSTIHRVASGVGTYDDPISVAVPGHSGQGAQIPCGTRIYYPDYGFYGIVEDTGATDFAGQDHTDIWVDGRGYAKDQSDRCMDPVTKNSVTATLNPPPNLPIREPGPITRGSTCDVGTAANSGAATTSESQRP